MCPSPSAGLKDRSTSRGRDYYRSPSKKPSNFKKEIATQMCEIIKGVKGGLNIQEAEKIVENKIDEMCVCEDEEEVENDQMFMDCVENFDTKPSLENIQTTINTLQNMAAAMNVIST